MYARKVRLFPRLSNEPDVLTISRPSKIEYEIGAG